MKILLAEHRGFCYGVKRAVALAEECIDSNERTRTLGPIIHNPQLVEKLTQQGIASVDSLNDIQSGNVIIRSHGVGPEIYQDAERKGLNIIDATCPHVKKAQQSANALSEEGYRVIVIGEKRHPEVQSILKWSASDALVIETLDEAKLLPFIARVGIVAQTTFCGENFEEIVTEIKKHCNDIKIARTICTATEMRQTAAVALAKKVDKMVVIGGKNSANTTRLAELCRAEKCKVQHIETSDELRISDFLGVNTVGITAGASTPEWIIEEVYVKMQEMEQLIEQGFRKIERNTIIKGTVVSVRPEAVFVDIGYKGEGIINLNELAFPTPESALGIVNVGDVIDVYVINVDGTSGIELSKLKADCEVAWEKLQILYESKAVIEGKVVKVVKGGLRVSVLGIEGFVPASHVDLKFVEDLTSYQDTTISLIPIELDLDKQKIVLSRKMVLQQEHRQAEEAVFSCLQEGQTVSGTVTKFMKFGVFVKIQNIVEGLIHISDLSWGKVKSPEEVLSIGDTVSVLILKVDKQAKRISLGLKQMEEDPWLKKIDMYKPGMNVQGKVSKLSKFGAFVALSEGIEGLVHLSELADKKISSAEEIFETNQLITVKILDIDKNNKRISLSFIKAQEEKERAEYLPFLDQQAEFSFSIGDKLAALLKEKA